MKTRHFLAADLSIGTVERLMEQQEKLYQALHKNKVRVRLVHPEHIRLPLKFLGFIDDALYDLLFAQLRAAAQPLFPFQLRCTRLKCTPSPKRPRIISSDLDKEGSEVVALLQRMLDKELEEIGLERSMRPFAPGVMLARLASKEPIDISNIVSTLETTHFGTNTIKDLILYTAEIGPYGPEYNVVHRFPLGSI